jgi:hypothetical protein
MGRNPANPRPHQDDRRAESLSEAARALQGQTRSLPFHEGNKVSVSMTANSSKVVYHHLGHVPQGYLLWGVKGDEGNVSYTAKDDKTITFKNAAAAAAVTFDAWVF